jgi:cobalt-zinc-cadmium efflux system protein
VFALLISGIIMYSIKDLLYESLNILILGKPSDIDINLIEDSLCEISDVLEVHHTHIWSISSDQTVVSTHIVINDEQHLSRVLNEAHNKLDSDFNIHHSTIQVETEDFTTKSQHNYRE